MQIKEFTGASIDEILPRIREELGEDALILQTRRVVRGGIGGFFGREGIEVTAAEGPSRQEMEDANREAAATLAPPRRRPQVDAHDDEALPATTAAAADPAPDDGDDADPAPEPFARHLASRLGAAREAEQGLDDPAPAPEDPPAAGTYAPPRATPPRPFAPGGDERTRALVAAAQEAVRAAAAHAQAAAPQAVPVPVPAVAPAPRRSAASVPPPAAFTSGIPAAPAPAQDDPPAPARDVPARLRGLRADLLSAGVLDRHADQVIEAIDRQLLPFAPADSDVRDLARDWLAARLPVVRDWRPRAGLSVVALVGQTGVGKSTTACRLAARLAAAGQSVAVVAAGHGPHDLLRGMAGRLGIDVLDAPDATALAEARAALADRDVVIVDTAGRSHQSLPEMEDLRDLLSAAKPDEVHLVLPVATPPADLGDLARRFRMAGVNRVTMTKLDETGHHGNLVNVPLKVGKPLAFLTEGPSDPATLVPADARRIAGMLLGEA